jgi:hypothetical protein
MILLSYLFISKPTFSDEPNYASDRILVKFAAQQGIKSLRSIEKEALVESVCGGSIEHEYGIVNGLTLVKLPEGQTVQNSIESLKLTDGILYAEP